jgi:phosphatidylglycerophosphate synthase
LRCATSKALVALVLSLTIVGCASSSFYTTSFSCSCIAITPLFITTLVSCYSYFLKFKAKVLRRQVSYSSFNLLLIVLLISRLRVLSYSASTRRGLNIPADNNFTCYFFKVNLSFFSNLAIFLLVYLLSPLSESLKRK